MLAPLALAFALAQAAGAGSSPAAAPAAPAAQNAASQQPAAPNAASQQPAAPQDDQPVAPPDYSWWRQARFGMFIHWGLYAEAAGSWQGRFVGGWTEWLLSRVQIDPVAYQRELIPRFDPVPFDAGAIVRAAKRAGMGYIVITTKHHEGFCLWDSADSSSDIAMTPFGARGRSLLKELADACAREGIRLGFYYSLLDWYDTDYLPRRSWDKRTADGASYPRYAQRMRTHVQELLGGQFGQISILWGDGDWEHGHEMHESKATTTLARALQPGILINNRWAMPGDYDTPENKIPDAPPARAWETCMTMNESWGYTPRVETYKPASELIRMLADIASKDGNFLLNVGPDGQGAIDAVAMERLGEIGRWMDINAQAIRGTRGAHTIGAPAVYPWGRLTVRAPEAESAGAPMQRGVLYCHVFDRPESGEIVLPGVAADIIDAKVLGMAGVGGEPVRAERRGADAVVWVPPGAPGTGVDTVVRLEVSSWPPVAGTPVPSIAPGLFLGTIDLGFPMPPGSSVSVTTDGSDPVAPESIGPGGSAVELTRPVQTVTLSKSARVRARSVLRGTPTGTEFSGEYTAAELWPAVDARGASPWTYTIRIIEGRAGDFSVVPGDDSFAKATRMIVSPSLSIPPGLPEDNYALEWEGLVDVPSGGIWTFWLTSDDGSRMWIDGRPVIDNDGPHGAVEVRGQAPLAAGLHRLRIRFFEAGGAASMEAHWSGPGVERTVLAPAAATAAATGAQHQGAQ